jgi:NAD(P)-dependent dehydrogenase (short-subunit alcohol dehydrogenase family)
MDGKIALVTGATSGIGKAVATGLAKEGAAVTIVARDRAKGERVAKEIGGKVEVLECDLSSQASIRSAAMMFLGRHDKLHVLVNSAGVFVKEKKTTVDGIELTFATNYLAYFLLTNQLLPALKRGAPSRVVNVSSRYGGAKIDFDDLQKAKQPYSYLKSTPQTMLARVLFTQELAERLEGTGVVANTLHPGLVANTQLLDDTGGIFRWMTNTFGGTPERGADTALWLATAPETASVTGKMFAKRKEIKTPGQGSDPAARKRLWDESAKLTKLA